MKIETIVKAFAENNMAPIAVFAESIMSRLTDCPNELSLVPVNEEHRKGLGLMYKDLEIAIITLPCNEEDEPYYEIYSDWFDLSAEREAGDDTDADDLAELLQEEILADLPDIIPLLNQSSTQDQTVAAKAPRVFYEKDRAELQALADKLNADMKRTDARVIVTNGAEDNLIVMVVGYEDGEVSDEYGFFLDLPYTDEAGEDENYVLHYAGYPDMNDYTFSTVDLGQLSAAIEELDLM